MNSVFRSLAALAAGILLLAVSSLPPQAQQAGYLSGDQIRARVVGNTIQGVHEGLGYFEYLRPDGTIRGSRGLELVYVGRWRLQGSAMCFSYDLIDWAQGCYQIRLNGNRIGFYKDGEEEGVATLLSGNPRGFF